MRKIRLHIIFILLVGLSTISVVKAQRVLHAESAHLWADRSLYISGENVNFAGLIVGEESLSQLMYVELISPLGNKVNQQKVKLKNNHFQGSIEIPSDILSGYYYLRAYTKWMRNGSNKDYAYVLIKVINPYSDEVSLIPDSLINNNIFQDNQASNTPDIQKFHPNERISFKPDIQDAEILSFSMIPTAAKPLNFQINGSDTKQYSHLEFYPETRGISLSGVLKSKNSDKVLAYHLISLHIIGEKDMISILSDSVGRFHFALPEKYGFNELFLIAASLENDEAEIQIDQDYCVQDIALEVPPFEILDKDIATILQMAQNQQVYHTYHEEDTLVNPVVKSMAFYGQAFKTIDFSYYVPLDSLEQYFTDIPSWVVIKRRKGKRYFQIYGTQGELKLYPPLVLVDWVPVDDADRVLAIHPVNVEKIDIITESYIHGDIVYGGIISIMTKKTDFGGLKFPESGMYLNFEFYHVSLAEKPYDLCRNTHLWYPNISNDSLLQNLEIKAPKQKGEYLLLIQGVDTSGSAIEWREPFIVE